MSATFYRKTLGVGPYETVDDYFADVNPDGSFMAFVQNQKDNGLILELEMKMAKAKNAWEDSLGAERKCCVEVVVVVGLFTKTSQKDDARR